MAKLVKTAGSVGGGGNLSARIGGGAMKRGLYGRAALVAAVLALFASATAFGGESKWDYSVSTGTTWQTAADWNDVANWLGGVVPNASDAIASFTNDCNGTRYVRLPESGVTLDALALKNSSSSYVNVTGGKLTTHSIATSGNNNFNFFCDIDFAFDSSHKAGQAGYSCQNFAGRVSMPQVGSPTASDKNNWTCGSSGSMPRHRLDWGATSEDWSENIVNPCPTNGMQSGSGGGKYIYAPRGTDEAITLTGCTLVNGSKLVTLASGAKARSTLPVGTRVTGDGIPPDTYLRYIYSETLIEITKAYDGEDTSAGSITFAAYSPHVYQDMLWFDCWAGGPQQLLIGKYREKDVFRLTLRTLHSQNGSTSLAYSLRLSVPTTGMVPATLVLKNTDYFNSKFEFSCGHVEFHPNGSKGLNSKCRTTFYTSSSTARITCVEGGDATIGCLTNWIGSLTKDGPATLTLGVRGVSNNKLVVNEGKVVWTNTVPEDVGPDSQRLTTLEVAGGATLSLAKGCSLAVTSGTFADGATLEIAEGATLTLDAAAAAGTLVVRGPGRVLFTKASAVPSGISLQDGAVLSVVGEAGGLVVGRPTPAIVGTPAFWVDASDDASLVYEEENGVKYVTRWNDRRGSYTEGWNFATNLSARPVLMIVTNQTASGQGPGAIIRTARCVRIPTTTDAANCAALVWGKPIEGIKSVFLAMSAADGGGCILGSTKPFVAGNVDFARGYVDGAELFSNAYASPNVKEAPMAVNGMPVTRTFKMSSATNPRPFLFEVHPLAEGARADVFGQQGARWDLSGGQRIYECIIYTNELTLAERAQVAEALMQKWFDTGYNPPSTVAAGGEIAVLDTSNGLSLDVASGSTVAKTLSGSGTFVKTGAGELHIGDATGVGALVVSGGVLSVNSVQIPALGDLPTEGLYFHLDANDLSTSETAEISGKGLCVKKWGSVRSGTVANATATTTNYPAVKTIGAGDSARVKPGMKTIDMGPLHSNTTADGYGSWITKGSAENMNFTRSDNIRSAFFVFKGANTLLGHHGEYHNYHGAGLPRGSLTANPLQCTPTDPPVSLTQQNSVFQGEPYYSRMFVEGARINAATDPLENEYSIISLSTFYLPIRTSAFACEHYNNTIGGQEIGEVMLYTRWLPDSEIKKVEAYLRKKWYGLDTPGSRSASADAIEVASGATLAVSGGAPVETAGLAGGGTVAGDVALAAGAVIRARVDASGEIVDTLSVTGSIDFSRGGTVVLEGEVSKIKAREWTLVASSSIVAGSAAGWTCANTPRYTMRVAARNGALVLRVVPKGMNISVK